MKHGARLALRRFLIVKPLMGIFPREEGNPMTLAELHRQKRTETRPAGEHLKRLRKLAKSADKREGRDITHLSHEERIRLATGAR
jgi:hypothetical protein